MLEYGSIHALETLEKIEGSNDLTGSDRNWSIGGANQKLVIFNFTRMGMTS